jgi:hypothetical protein
LLAGAMMPTVSPGRSAGGLTGWEDDIRFERQSESVPEQIHNWNESEESVLLRGRSPASFLSLTRHD